MFLQPKIPLDTHLFLASKIVNEIYMAMYGRYDHHRVVKVCQYTLNHIRDYLPRKDDLIQLLLTLVNRKSKIQKEYLIRVLSLLEDDYNRYPDSFYDYYGPIYDK